MSLQTKTAASFLLFFFGLVGFASAQDPNRTSFNDDWLFELGEPASGLLREEVDRNALLTAEGKSDPHFGSNLSYSQITINDDSWRRLDLPHDWCIEGEFDPAINSESAKLNCAGIGWYRKHFEIPETDRGKRIYVEFDGVMSHSAVWINGSYVGGWPYGYASFAVDLTPFVVYGGRNTIAVRMDHPPDSGRWYSGAGIYRNVWLRKTGQIRVADSGITVTTLSVRAGAAEVAARVTVENHDDRSGQVTTRITIRKASGENVAGPVETSLEVAGNGSTTSVTDLTIHDPHLWSPEAPVLYEAVVEIRHGETTLETRRVRFGIRTIQFDPDRGLLVNGDLVEIKGVCFHHDLGAIGVAVNKRAMERRLDLLQEMGVNAIRTSHNPPAPELLDMADERGILILDEAFDSWKMPKRANDYSINFADWHERDLRAMVRRDRNHPSVILWSIGNEVAEQMPDGHAIAAELARIVHEEDATRPVTAAANMVEAGYNGFEKNVDVFGYNYKPGEYDRFHRIHPDIPLLSTESSSTISSRGEYFFPLPKRRWRGLHDREIGVDEITGARVDSFLGGHPVPDEIRYYFYPELEPLGQNYTNFQISSYDLIRQAWADHAETEFRGQEQNPFVAGEFVWTGLDYLGEINPFESGDGIRPQFDDPDLVRWMSEQRRKLGRVVTPQRSSYFGILDLCGFKKDRFYLYHARWRPDLPMAHILPHWNWPDRVGKVTPVHVYTSGDEAELFLNGRSLGRRRPLAGEYRIRWDDVVYEPGELKVVAYKAGSTWATDSVSTTGPVEGVELEPEKSSLDADGHDLVFVTVSLIDSRSRIVPTAKDRIKLEISGPGEIAAFDNGDATDLESFHSLDRCAFNGLAQVVVRSIKGKPGRITLRASVPGIGRVSLAELVSK